MSNLTMLGSARLLGAIVLVVLIVFAVGVVIPVVLSVREAAARTNSNCHLRQIAIAVHNYHGTNDRLPDAASTGGSYKQPGEERSMWFHLLPYLEQSDVYKKNIHDACPYLTSQDTHVGNVEGKINYAANIRLFGYETLGKDIADNAVGGTGDPSGQTLAGHLRATMTCGLTLRDIKDGTSNTLMITTRYADCGSPVQSTYYSASPIGTMLTGGGPVASVGVPKSTAKGAFFGAGSHDAPADPRSIQATFQLAPRLAECRPDDSVFGHSFSTGGLSVAVADASIRSLDPNMSTTLFCRMLCPSDGFPLQNEWGND